MSLPFFIARRYFFSKKRKSFISLLSNISMIGIALGTAALVVVLSVFNGLEDLNRKNFKHFDSDLKISPKEGKIFILNSTHLQAIKHFSGVAAVTQVIEDNALLRYKNAQSVVMIKGVEDSFLQRRGFDSTVVSGKLTLSEKNVPYAIVGMGVYYGLSANINDEFTPLEALYPTEDFNINLPSNEAFRHKSIYPSGVFGIEPSYDSKYVFVPLAFAQDLFGYDRQRSSLEIDLTPQASLNQTKAQIQAMLGSSFLVQSSDEQHADLYRAIQIEKLFVFIALSLIIALASFNIFFSLMMLVIEKQSDIKILVAIGATPVLIRQIFFAEGAIIGCIGIGCGIAVGFVLASLQQLFGWVHLGFNEELPAYPVRIEFFDFLGVALIVVLITLVATIFPAKKASAESVFA